VEIPLGGEGDDAGLALTVGYRFGRRHSPSGR
jgi:hypothetical protein